MAGADTAACRGQELWTSSGREGGGSAGWGREEWEGCGGEMPEAGRKGREGRQPRLSLHLSFDIVFRVATPRWMHTAGAKRAPSLSSVGEASHTGPSPRPSGPSPRQDKPRGLGALMRLSWSSDHCFAFSPTSATLGCAAAQRPEAHDAQLAAQALPPEPQAARGDAPGPAPGGPSLESFPGEVLFKILCLLPRASWPAARQVCRSWREAMGSGDMVRQRRALGVAEAWAFQVEWMFPRGRNPLALLWALDPAAHRWYALGCLPPMPGISHTSHVCEFGRYAVFLGGNARRGGAAGLAPGASAWRYNLITGHVRRLPDMLQARVGCGSAAVGGRLLVAGGTGENDVALKAAEAFDPAQGKWVRLPDLRVARRHCVGFEVGGRFWVLSLGAPSESMSRSAQVYDLASQTWTLIPQMLPPGLGGRLTTRVALVGGRLVLTSHVRTCQHVVMGYDELRNEWHTLGELPVLGFRGYGVVGLPSGNGREGSLLVEGGIECGAEEMACHHHVLQRTPYVSQFLAWSPREDQWKPNASAKGSTGAARRCQHCIVSSL